VRAFELARYNPDGSLDTSFGTHGLVSAPIGRASALAIQSDGKIVVGGNSAAGALLARYSPDGSLDPAFGDHGVTTTSIGIASGIGSLVLQKNGKIIAGGFANLNGPYLITLARYNQDGSLDASFGNRGVVVSALGTTIGDTLALQSDGKVVVGGTTPTVPYRWRLARYLSDGSLDSSFGSRGTVTTQVVGSSPSFVDALAIQPDGKIVAGGVGADLVDLARYNPSGSLDSTFGTGGTVASSIWLGDDPVPASVAGLALQPGGGGGIIVAANSPVFSVVGQSDFLLMRYLGTPNCLVPNLRGKREAKAKLALLRYGCSVGATRHHFSHGVRKGRVISQYPAPHLVTAPGSKVNLVVSKGKRR
jgi:uncharacterized delta-60 repeat protein